MSRLIKAAFNIPWLRAQAALLLGSGAGETRAAGATGAAGSGAAASATTSGFLGDGQCNAADLLASALAIDAGLGAWEAALDDVWLPLPRPRPQSPNSNSHTTSTNKSEHESSNDDADIDIDIAHLANQPTWANTHDDYTSILTASVLNHYRVFRLLALGVARRCIERLSEQGYATAEGRAHEAMARRASRALVDAICGSVPWHLGEGVGGGGEGGGGGAMPEFEAASRVIERGRGAKAKSKAKPSRDPDAGGAGSDGGGGSGGVGDPSGAYYLIWPLFVAMSVDCIPLRQQSWIRGRLGYLGETHGFRQAEVLADRCR